MAIKLVTPVCNRLPVPCKLPRSGGGPERAADLVARYGGEEFALIGPCTDPTGAIHVAQVIRSQVRNCAIAHRSSPVSQYVTLSLGVATIKPTSDTEPPMLIAAADRALYQAKASGRDRLFFNDSLIANCKL
ncbi:MAG: diguanylate cyclase [Hormoscilla sp. GUM202]|nr:diguanylate cyclase [Hormoscilla sp. GUM202]